MSNTVEYLGCDAVNVSSISTYDSIILSTSKEYDNGGKINYLAIALPVSQKSGIAFGIMPYSAVGYNSSSVGQIEDTKNEISGSGSLSLLFVGY